KSTDKEINQLLRRINEPNSEKAVFTERSFLNLFDDQESAPIGGYAIVNYNQRVFNGAVISDDGKKLLEHKATGIDPQSVAKEVFEVLASQGAIDIIEQVKE